HGVSWRNIRFYFNPVTTKIEPIAYDLMCGSWDEITEKNARGEPSSEYPRGDFDWLALALEDKVFAELYVKEALRVCSPEYLANLRLKIKKDLKRQELILWQEKPETVDWSKIEDNQNLYRNVINPIETVRAYVNPDAVKDKTSNAYSVEIKVENLLTLPVEVLGVRINKDLVLLKSGDEKINTSNKYILPGSRPFIQTNTRTFYVPIDSRLINDGRVSVKTKFQVYSRLLGNPKDYFTDALLMPKPKLMEGVPEPPQIDEFLKQNSFFEYNKERNELYLPQGEWQVNGDLVLPKGVNVIFAAGVTLKFKPGAIMVVNGSTLSLRGSQDYPVRLCAQDKIWSGLIAFNSQGSILENVVIEDATNVDRGGWILTGGATFYDSSVVFNRLLVQNNHCEDALNLIHTEYTMINSLFKNIFSDALDNDFCQGIIKDTIFMDVKADALDVSGTNLKVENMKAYRLGDKGLSVGEKSNVYAQNVVVEQADFGAASKDLSKLEIDGMQITNTKIGLAAYQKKPEYGPAEIKANNVSFNQVAEEVLCQIGSSVVANGKEYAAKKVDIDKLYEKWKDAK
ncbi:MAG: hypothetical protein PHG69_06610, partial [Candidatus Omnitrophica bacterium]|nr:hypothetical protein [Candidatus Omnitrophota bacterium]